MMTLTEAATTLGWKPFRLRQVQHAREIELVASWDDITTLPAADRAFLNEHVPFDVVSIVKASRADDDSAVKFLLRGMDGATFEMVVLIHRGEKRTWATVCVSSQIGCPVKCRFCATGQMTFARNLSADEIVNQFLIAKREAKKRGIDRELNVVFMGMGEPLLNLDAVIPAIRTLLDPQRFGLAHTRITVSTSGIVPGLRALYAEKLGIGLALSLHAPTDELRTKLMPINEHFPLPDVMAALEPFERDGTEILYEYILIAGMTDTPACIDALTALLRARSGKLNLIPLNPVTGTDFRRPELAWMRTFRNRLEQNGLTVTLRHTKGDDIAAACGQLKTEHVEKTFENV